MTGEVVTDPPPEVKKAATGFDDGGGLCGDTRGAPITGALPLWGAYPEKREGHRSRPAREDLSRRFEEERVMKELLVFHTGNPA